MDLEVDGTSMSLSHPEKVLYPETDTTQHHKDHDNVYPLVNNARTLVWMAQISALEIHVPQWKFDGFGTPQHPDRLVLDLDPGEGAGLAECAVVALLAWHWDEIDPNSLAQLDYRQVLRRIAEGTIPGRSLFDV